MIAPAWRGIKTTFWWLLATVFVLFALWVLVARHLMASVDDYRMPLEILFEEKARTPMEIGVLSGRVEGLNPHFVLQDVRLYSSDNASETLRLDQVDITIDLLQTLLHRELRIRYLRLQGLDVQLEVTADGAIEFAGIKAIGSTHEVQRTPLERILDIAYRQQHIELADTAVTLITPNRPMLRFHELQGLWVRQGEHFRFAFKAAEREDRVQLEARLQLHNRAYRWDDLIADGYLRVRLQNMEPWLVPEELFNQWGVPVRPQQFSARLENWLHLNRGKVEQMTSNVWLSDVQLAVSGQDEPWRIGELGFQAHLTGQAENFQVQLDGLQLTHNKGHFRLGNWFLHWQEGNQWQLKGYQLLLPSLQQLLAGMPAIGEEAMHLQNILSSFSVSGQLTSVEVKGHGKNAQRALAHYQGLGFELPAHRLNVEGLDGWLAVQDDHVSTWIDSSNALLAFDSFFDAPIAVSVRGPAGFYFQPEAWQLVADALTLENHDASAVASLVVRGGAERIPELSLLGRVEEGQVARASRYIPFRKMPDNVAQWLRQALREGNVTLGDFLHEGPLRIDPLRQQDRTFQMVFDVVHGRLHFLENWPDVENLSGQIVVDGREVRGKRLAGKFLGMDIRDGTVDMPMVAQGQPLMLNINAQASTPLDALTTLFHDTPLAKQLPKELKAWRFQGGELQGAVQLGLPLTQPDATHPQPFQVHTSGRVSGALAASNSRNIELTQLESQYRFDLQEGLELVDLQGQLLGYPLHGKATTRDQQLQFSWRSDISLPVLRNWLSADWLEDASGVIRYNANLSLPWGGNTNPRLAVTSDLHQVQLALPPPFFKASNTRVPSELTLRFLPDKTLYGARYGNSVRLQAQSGKQGLDRLAVTVGGGSVTLPRQRGIAIRGNVGTSNASRWVDFVTGKMQAGGSHGKAQSTFMPWDINLTVQRLNLWGAEILGSSLQASVRPDATTLELNSERLDGTLIIPEGYRSRGTVPMQADIRHFNWWPYNASASDNREWGRVDPTSLPAVQVKLQQMFKQQDNLGSWNFELKADDQGVVIQNLLGQWRGLQIQGNGLWQRESGGSTRSHFTGQVSSDNVAAMLAAWGWPALMESPKASASLSLNWPGAPYEFDYLALQGEGEMAVETGRFPKADSKTSALRLLGMFNLATVTRRLRLDFSDLYKKGLSFEKFSGQFRFAGPQLEMKNFLIDSPSAEFVFSGDANLQERSLDHDLEVILPLSSNLYVGCIAGPVACAGIFVVERLWGSNLEKMTSLHYRVTGSWDSPHVEDVTSSHNSR